MNSLYRTKEITRYTLVSTSDKDDIIFNNFENNIGRDELKKSKEDVKFKVYTEMASYLK